MNEDDVEMWAEELLAHMAGGRDVDRWWKTSGLGTVLRRLICNAAALLLKQMEVDLAKFKPGDHSDLDELNAEDPISEPVRGDSSSISDANMLAGEMISLGKCPQTRQTIQRHILAVMAAGASYDQVHEAICKATPGSDCWDVLRPLKPQKPGNPTPPREYDPPKLCKRCGTSLAGKSSAMGRCNDCYNRYGMDTPEETEAKRLADLAFEKGAK